MMVSQRKAIATAIVIIFAGVSFLFISQGFGGEKRSIKDTSGNIPAIVHQLYKLPDSICFAGEKMPLENFDTRESLEREIIISTYRHSSTILIIKRANRYFPIIEKILKEYNIPDDFKYIPVAESDLSNMISPAGATGFWQIMPESGKEQGLEINTEIDERYHIEKSTRFACEYLLKSYAKYGNWTIAAASYNGGRNGIDDQIEIQHETNYYDLLLTEETARYIFRLAAYKLIITDPASYGFLLSKNELYPEIRFNEIKVDTAVTDLSYFARNLGTNYKLLKLLNPWLRKPYLTKKSNKTYMIKIPAAGSRVSDLADIY